jgi:hypothetical protein
MTRTRRLKTMRNQLTPPEVQYTIPPGTQALLNCIITAINTQISHSYIALFPLLRTTLRNLLSIFALRYYILYRVAVTLFLHLHSISQWVIEENRVAFTTDEEALRRGISDFWEDFNEFIQIPVPVAERVVTWGFVERVRRRTGVSLGEVLREVAGMM